MIPHLINDSKSEENVVVLVYSVSINDSLVVLN